MSSGININCSDTKAFPGPPTAERGASTSRASPAGAMGPEDLGCKCYFMCSLAHLCSAGSLQDLRGSTSHDCQCLQ